MARMRLNVRIKMQNRATAEHRLNGERDLTASLNIPDGAIVAANDGANAFNRAYRSSFFYILCFILLFPLRRNRVGYLLLRNLKSLGKKIGTYYHYALDVAVVVFL